LLPSVFSGYWRFCFFTRIVGSAFTKRSFAIVLFATPLSACALARLLAPSPIIFADFLILASFFARGGPYYDQRGRVFFPTAARLAARIIGVFCLSFAGKGGELEIDLFF
jgi:hypothetical protein